MTKIELLALLSQFSGESASGWGAAVALEAATGPLQALTTFADNSATLFRVGIEHTERDAIDIPGALVNIGGAAKLEEQRGQVGGPASLALAALLSYASETHLDEDVVAGTGTVPAAGGGFTEEQAPDVAAGTGAADVAGTGSVQEGADVAAGEGEVV